MTRKIPKCVKFWHQKVTEIDCGLIIIIILPQEVKFSLFIDLYFLIFLSW